MSLRLVTIEDAVNFIANDIQVMADQSAAVMDDELPPPIPTEAKMNWLSGIAKAKGDMTEEQKTWPTKGQTNGAEMPDKSVELVRNNVWDRLPENALNGIVASSVVARGNTPIETRVYRRPGLAYAPEYRFIRARFDSHCNSCEDEIEQGDLILWYPKRKTVYCSECDEFRAANVERMQNGLNDVRRWME